MVVSTSFYACRWLHFDLFDFFISSLFVVGVAAIKSTYTPANKINNNNLFNNTLYHKPAIYKISLSIKMSENGVANLAEKQYTSEENVHNQLSNLSNFRFQKVLSNNTNRKLVCLQGSFGTSDGVGIVVLEKTAFEESDFNVDSDYFSEKSYLKKLFHNDIYGNYEYFPKLELNRNY